MNGTILVVDNDSASLRVTKSFLEEEGHEVVVAGTGRQCMRKVEEVLPQVILIDTMLPDMGWNELGRTLRANDATSRIPIIIMTPNASLNEMMIGNESHADDMLLKPFNSSELQRAILPLMSQSAKRAKTVVSTGNGELDSKMGGGIPLGSLTLIEGSSGAGKSVLVQQMIWGTLHDGFKLSLFTSENTIKSLVRQMRSLSLDVLDYLLLNRCKIYPLEFGRMGANAPEQVLKAMRRENKQNMIFVDSITSAIAHSSGEEVIGFFEGCKRLCSSECTVAVVLHSHAVGGDLLIRIRSLCDAHLQLRTEEMGDKLVRTMEVTKIRGADRTTGNIVSFDVEPGWGMRLIPVNKVKG